MSEDVSKPASLLEEAAKLRNRASRARRMARSLTQADDRTRLERYAEELEQQAAELERQPGLEARIVRQPQQQVQQQQGSLSTDDEKKG